MFEAKRSLGQNFFVNRTLIDKISSIVLQENPKSLLEIGPGQGAFSGQLNRHVERYYAIEKDDELYRYIKATIPKGEIFHDDILSIDLSTVVSPELQPETTLFGALPYNISKPIIHLLLANTSFKYCYLIIQKEVADKYIARDEPNKLAMTTALYAKVEKVMEINRESFRPRPKVISALIRIERIPHDLTTIEMRSIERLIVRSFTKPRKTLWNNLKGHYTLESLSPLDPDLRPHQIPIETFIQVGKSLAQSTT